MIQPILKEESGPGLRKMLDTTRKCVQALHVMKVETDKWDHILIYVISEKLDPETKRQWLLFLRPLIATLFDFTEFLENRCCSLPNSSKSKSSCSLTNPSKQSSNSQSKPETKTKSHHSSESKCRVCNQSAHPVFKCQEFVKLTSKERSDALKTADTELGWVIAGSFSSHQVANVTSFHVCCELHDLVRRFWELESLPEERTFSTEDLEAENHFQSTHQRLQDGRIWTVVFTADAKQMYWQFSVHPDDRDLQRIIWRQDPTSPLEDWRLTVVTQGQAASAFLATRSLQQLAMDELNNQPEAAAVTLRLLYMDDLITGEFDISKALHLQSQLLELFTRGKIELRKWTSIHPSILSALPDELRENKMPFEFTSQDSMKTLRINWNPGLDEFFYSKNIFNQDAAALTKIQ
ncbi:unnamed protein product, partial [Allacma fusca]